MLLFLIVIDDQKPATGQEYVLLSFKVIDKLRGQRPKTGFRGIFLHHGCVLTRIANITIEILKSTQAEINEPWNFNLAP